MKLLEYEAKEYFKKYGIPTPEGQMVISPEEASKYVASLGRPVVVKVQLPVGGRGKAGGVKFADAPEDASTVAKQLLGMTINGLRVKRLMLRKR